MRTINRDILKLALPSILANITVPLVGMVDIAVAGHLDTSAAVMIGGIAIGSMLFDLLYWNFGFLRVGTGGLAAQAYGRGDRKECARILTRALGIAVACALVLIAIQWVFVKAAFLVVDCTPEVRELASQYFFIRIWAAPATLSLMAFKGWFIGMQDSVSPMTTDLMVNGMNILMSIVLSMKIGFAGIAAGTVVAQYSGLLTAIVIMLVRYRRNTVSLLDSDDLKSVFKGGETRRFFVMNVDLYVRSLCFIAIYIGFTVISARYGDTLLAVSSIIMKLLMIFSYFTDGFAYAGEALVGKEIGKHDDPQSHHQVNPLQLSTVIRLLFVWSLGVGIIFTLIFYVWSDEFYRAMTSDSIVLEGLTRYTGWLIAMPIVSTLAFMWDGVYAGATAGKQIRNAMVYAALGFVAMYLATNQFVGVQSIYIAYFAHLLARVVYLTYAWPRIARVN